MVDVTENDVGEINIVGYLDPNLPRSKVENDIKPAFIFACKRCFGRKQQGKYFRLLERDQETARQELGGEIPLVAGGNEKAFNTLELNIHPEKARAYEVESLKDAFLRALNRKL
ncbi:MAG: hypothetical protein ABEN55_02550 [Bradymonadaceae bacterium]